jgi:hypothetical protein
MSTHKTVIIATNEGRWYARCSCKAHSPWYDHESEAEDWEYAHQREVQRARAHLGGRTPSTRDQYDYYRKRSVDPDISPEDRELWKVLADGLEHRVGALDHTDTLPLIDDGKHGPGDRLSRP